MSPDPDPTPVPPPPSAPPRARFRPHERVVDPAVFKAAFARKKSASDPWLIVYGVENGRDHARLGISAAKRRIRKACDRNEFKRLVREAFRLGKAELPAGVDLIVVPRGARLTFRQARASLPSLARGVARRLAPPAPRPPRPAPP